MTTLNKTKTAVHIQYSNKKGWSYDAHNLNSKATASGYASTPQQALQEALKVITNPDEAKVIRYHDSPVDWDLSITLIHSTEEKAWSYELYRQLGLTPESIAFGFQPTPEQALETALQLLDQMQ